MEFAVGFSDAGVCVPPEGAGDSEANAPVVAESVDEVEVVVSGKEVDGPAESEGGAGGEVESFGAEGDSAAVVAAGHDGLGAEEVAFGDETDA